MADQQDEVDAFIRDVTSVTHMSKSEVRLRLNKLLVRAIRETIQPILDIQNSLDDDYGEFDALDDIENYLTSLEAELKGDA